PDQAVKSLCETWHPDDIPTVFTACGRDSLCAQPEPPTPHAEPLPPPLMGAGFSKLFASRNTQLPSPVSPTSGPSPSPPADGCESYSQAPESSGGNNLIPIRGFVHEVLRRSRTSTGVLQTALCYLEAVRSRVPDLLRKEKARPTSERYTDQEPEPRIVQGLSRMDGPQQSPVGEVLSDVSQEAAGLTLDTIRVDDRHFPTEADASIPLQSAPSATRSKDQSSLPPLPPLPSPLCCPRRTFLACLILASKFMQDRSYSNRAWAKLAGLPPREIGRCERAVGEALEWRLWVGKLPTTSASSGSSGSCAGRTVSRARSDGDLLGGRSGTCTSSSTAAWAATATAGVDAHSSATSSQPRGGIHTPLPTPRTTRTIQRSATVPAIGSHGFAAPADPIFVPAGLFDETACYDARPVPGMGYPPTFAMNVEPQVEVSPSLSTPTLSYSPMSCSSSSSDGSEERTIQMSVFMDLPTPSFASVTAGHSGGPWVANVSMYTPVDPANPYCSTNHVNLNTYTSYYGNPLAMYSEAGTAENVAGGAVGPTLPAIDIPGTKTAVSTTLPSFAEAFSERCPGVLDIGTR
ncbi:hypothetical protein BV20DRAFT_936524, partial [Pilatotrama ljubarskyi]